MRGLGRNAMLDAAVAASRASSAQLDEAEYRARHLADQLALTMQASLLVQAGPSAVADAFIASRLGAGQRSALRLAASRAGYRRDHRARRCG
jgi:putative acyl-CoA dehydrogenase